MTAEPSPSTLDVLQTLSEGAGVCVHLGCGDGALTVKLAERGRFLVHALEADAGKVKAARAALQEKGLCGQASVEQWASAVLPYANDLVNVLVKENPGGVSEGEIRRVLAPNGIAWIRRRDAWSMIRKPWPGKYDEWTHWRHGADGNMVSHDEGVAVPAGLRWVAGPAQDAGGKKWYYDHVLVSAQGRNFYAYEDQITARDAFNGTLLWTRPLKGYGFRETGTEVPSFLQLKAKLGTRPSKVRPVAIRDRLYVVAEEKLMALDAATGEMAIEFGRVISPREILVEGNTLVVSDTNVVRAYDTSLKRPLWEAAIAAERIVAGDGSLFCLSSNLIIGLELVSGKERWRTTDRTAIPATTCTYHQGVLVLELSSWRDDAGGCGIRVYSGADGRLLWTKDYQPDMTHFKEARAFFARNLLWLQMQTNTVAGFDPLTGKLKKSWGGRGKHCSTPVATEHYFMSAECEFTDLATGSRSRARMFKSGCRLPFIPANGLLYSFPVQCECYPMLRGYMGLASATSVKAAKTPRFERGPAFGNGPAGSFLEEAVGTWPMYRHDVVRSGGTPTTLRGAGLRQSWAVQVTQPLKAVLAGDWKANPFVRGLITPPVAAGDRVVVAVPDEHRVVALNAKSGELRWSFTAGGRIDSPPALHEDLCLFGAHDGWVYCLNAANGELAWRYRVAPQERRIMAYGQMESLWPVPGSVLVDHGVAYAAAGRHPMSDGGVQVVALQARTGEVVWGKTIKDLALRNWYGQLMPNKKKVGVDFEPVDMLVKDGEFVSMSRWRFNPANGDLKLNLASTNYEALGTTVPRGVWGYGIRQIKSVENKLPAVFGQARLHLGTTNDVALLLAGETLVTATQKGELRVGEESLQLGTPPVHDGLMAAYGRLYVSAQDGKVVCFE